MKAGQKVSHYRVLERLGAGGMGEVFRAEDLRLGRPVALKFLARELGRDPVAKARFMQEARAASALDHANVCTLYDVGETDDGQLYLAMAFYEGETLQKRLSAGPLPVDEALDIAEQISRGLAEAHDQGIIHRDIKPANLMLSRDGRVKIVDFGLAKLAEDPGLTRRGTSVGTPIYMSAEQARGATVDHRTDLWSLGAVLYEMISGRRPFRDGPQAAIVHAILHEDPPALSKLRSGVSPAVERLVTDLLARDPARRVATAHEALDRIRAARTETPIPAEAPTLVAPAPVNPGLPPGAVPRSRRALPWAIGATVLMSALLAILVWLPGEETEPTRRTRATSVGESSVLGDRKMIVVFPFENLGPPERAYFAAGVTQELTRQLAAIAELGVISRNTAAHYPAAGKPMEEIGADLGVDYVLEGAVLWAPSEDASSRVRITPQLIRVADDIHLWADAYEATLDDVFKIQSEIAEAVVAGLEVTLGMSQRASSSSPPTENVEAHDLFLRGSYLFDGQDLEGALALFLEAVALDPGFSRAWTGLGLAYLGLGTNGTTSLAEGCSKARHALGRALELDDRQPEAWAELADLRRWCDFDWRGAYEAAQRGLACGPNSIEALGAASAAAGTLGKLEEAIELAARAQRLDPVQIGSYYRLSFAQRNAGLLTEAEATLKRALELGMEGNIRQRLGLIHLLQGYPALALDEMANERRPGYRLYYQALAYHDLGRQEDADNALARLIEDHASTMAYQIGVVHAYRDEPDPTFVWLERALAQRDPGLATAGTSVLLENVHNDPRWEPFLGRLGLR